ncbi:hypothetical protein Thermus77420_16540 [Thermus thalpophilus]
MAVRYEVLLYEDASGHSQIKVWLLSLKKSNPRAYAKARWLLYELLPSQGPNLREPYAKHINGPIWELRHNSGIRIYYWRQETTIFVAAAGEVKQQNKADPELISYALRAYQEFNSEE